jgi:hypothetical protein
MNLSSARPFFVGQIPYATLSTPQRAIYSIAVAVRIWFSLQKTHLICSLICVGIGGCLGWEGEIWSPWGWPPALGSMEDLWLHPGLGTIWARVRLI